MPIFLRPASTALGVVPPAFHDLRSPRFQNCTVCHQKVHGSHVDRNLTEMRILAVRWIVLPLAGAAGGHLQRPHPLQQPSPARPAVPRRTG